MNKYSRTNFIAGIMQRAHCAYSCVSIEVFIINYAERQQNNELTSKCVHMEAKFARTKDQMFRFGQCELNISGANEIALLSNIIRVA